MVVSSPILTFHRPETRGRRWPRPRRQSARRFTAVVLPVSKSWATFRRRLSKSADARRLAEPGNYRRKRSTTSWRFWIQGGEGSRPCPKVFQMATTIQAASRPVRELRTSTAAVVGDLLGVSYVVSETELPEPFQLVLGSGPRLRAPERYQRAFVATSAQVVAAKTNAGTDMAQPDFDRLTAVLLAPLAKNKHRRATRGRSRLRRLRSYITVA